MADLTNRSRFCVTIKNRDDLTRHFSFSKLGEVEAYMAELRKQNLKPRVGQLDESWLVRIREKGHKPLSQTFASKDAAEKFIARVTEERGRSLFIDYPASLKVSLADLFVRYLREEAPKHKSRKVLAYSLEGWLEDSGPASVQLLKKYRDSLRAEGQPVRAAAFKMRKSSEELAWIHKPLSEITTTDVETFINDRLEAVEPGTVDREIDRLKDVFKVATKVPYLQVFYFFQVMTAARRGETMSLPWRHVDFEAGTAFLPETKNGRPRKLALRQDLLMLLQDLPRATEQVFAVGLDYVVGAWAKACAMAGIEDLHIHDARHEALSRLAESGRFTLPELQTFSGHRDLRMLMRYAHLCASRLAKKIDECFKDESMVRVHRGRRFLAKTAGIPIASLTTGEPTPREASSAQEDAASAHSLAPCQSASTVVASAETQSVAASERTAAVIAFPAARVVRSFDSKQADSLQTGASTAA